MGLTDNRVANYVRRTLLKPLGRRAVYSRIEKRKYDHARSLVQRYGLEDEFTEQAWNTFREKLQLLSSDPGTHAIKTGIDAEEARTTAYQRACAVIEARPENDARLGRYLNNLREEFNFSLDELPAETGKCYSFTPAEQDIAEQAVIGRSLSTMDLDGPKYYFTDTECIPDYAVQELQRYGNLQSQLDDFMAGEPVDLFEKHELHWLRELTLNDVREHTTLSRYGR